MVLTNYQASLAINTATLISASKMQADCDDIRLTDNTGQALSFYIDENSEVCNSSSTRIYFKYPQIPTSGALVYFYYGNSSARRVVNPTDETNLRPGVAHFDATAGKATAIDYLIVRQYASTEPTVSVAVAEEVGQTPVAHWKFDEGYATTAQDSARGNNGTITVGASGSNTAIGTCTAPGARADGKNGKINFAINFDGTDDFIDGFSIPAQTGVNNLTVSGFIRPTVNQYSRFFTPTANGVDNWIAYNTDGSLEVFYTEIADVNNRSFSSTAGSIPLNTWTHFTVSINDKTIKIYINGALNAQKTETVNIGNWSGALTIGRRISANYFGGLLDDLKIFNYELSLQQVKDLATGGAVVFR